MLPQVLFFCALLANALPYWTHLSKRVMLYPAVHNALLDLVVLVGRANI